MRRAHLIVFALCLCNCDLGPVDSAQVDGDLDTLRGVRPPGTIRRGNQCLPAPTCSDPVCNHTETCSTCAGDCGVCPMCGDSACNGAESCSTCTTDCGACPTTCGDGTCDAAEDCM